MALEPIRDGYWADPDADGRAGTIAVVIGVSSYDHLPKEPTDPDAAATYGLGQLNVSALTAYTFFEWLRDEYRFARAPLNHCWVLASPTADEVEYESALQLLPRPTLAGCAKALGDAMKVIEAMHPSLISESRFLFFFSGHGIERNPHHLLCPSDYLEPPLRNPNGALDTLNLRSGLRRYSLRDDFFFIDACRTNPREMADIKLEGTSILVEMPAFQASPNRHSPILWATKSGAESWQPSTPQRGTSIFGQALIEGLTGKAKLDEECGHPPGHFTIDGIHSYVRRRVQALLNDYGQTSVDPVRKGGDYGEACITAPITTPSPTPDADSTRGRKVMKVLARVRAPRLEMSELAALPVQLAAGGIVAGKSEPTLRELFKSDALSRMWHGARAIPLENPEQSSEIRIQGLEWLGAEALRLQISVLGSGTHWLQLTDERGMSYACVLPDDEGSIPVYAIEIAREQDAPLRHFSVSFSAENAGLIGNLAELWLKYQQHSARDAVSAMDADIFEHALQSKLKYQQSSARDAVSAMDADIFEHALQSKMNSPLAATVASLLLLRARKFGRLHDWVGNLAKWFPSRTDGAIIRAEQIRQSRQTIELPAEYAERLLTASTGQLPQLNEVVSYAVEQVRELLQFEYQQTVTDPPRIKAREALMRYDARLSRAMRYFRSGGLCAVYIGPEAEISPQLVLPSR